MLHDVAQKLHTELILPQNHHVANAVGAVAGSVMASEELLVYPKLSSEGLDVIGYTLQNRADRREFETANQAISPRPNFGPGTGPGCGS